MITIPSQPTTCPRCDAPKDPELWLCDPCFQREPFCCAICAKVDALAHGLCADCAERDAEILDLDPDQPIPYTLTSQALIALELVGEQACPNCGHVRGVVFGTGSHRCYQCQRSWLPTPA